MVSKDFLLPLLVTFFAGLSTVLGSFVLFIPFFRYRKFIAFFLSFSAGLMIYLSLVELLSISITNIGFFKANILFFIGMLLTGFIDYFFPHQYLKKDADSQLKNSKFQMYRQALIITAGLTIHNFPEGAGVFLTSINNINFGILFAFAIAIHNIPEGIAIAIPIFHATKSKLRAIGYTLLAALVEPLGALIALIFLRPFIGHQLIFSSFAFVSGVMVYISFDELLPYCFKEKVNFSVIFGIILGMFSVFISLLFLNY